MKSDVHSACTGVATEGKLPRSISHRQLVAPVRVQSDGRAQASVQQWVSDSSDDKLILAQVHLALHRCGYDQLRNVRALCRHGRVVLHGSVSTYYLKQVAQELVTNIAEIRGVKNNLSVENGRV